MRIKVALRCVLRLSPFLPVLPLTACGPESTSAYTATQDTVTTSGSITIDGPGHMIHIREAGPSVQSEKIEECVIGFDREDLSFSFKSDEELVLDAQTLDYLRPLTDAEPLPQVDGRLFAVWQVPRQTRGQVSYSIEVEIRADTITYRNKCLR